MAKKGNRIKIKLVSDNGDIYYSEKNRVNTTEKLELRKFNKKERKHITYKEVAFKKK